MKSTLIKGLIWKVPFLTLAVIILYFEVDSYNNTKGSIGELLLYPNQENAFLVSATFTLVLGIALILIKNRPLTIVLAGLICLIVLLFFPSFDMQGVEQPF